MFCSRRWLRGGKAWERRGGFLVEVSGGGPSAGDHQPPSGGSPCHEARATPWVSSVAGSSSTTTTDHSKRSTHQSQRPKNPHSTLSRTVLTALPTAFCTPPTTTPTPSLVFNAPPSRPAPVFPNSPPISVPA